MHGHDMHTCKTGHERCWSQVDIGPTHNIFMSPYIDYRPGSDQYDWFYNDLISIDRTLTPWVIVSASSPPHSQRPVHSLCMARMLWICLPLHALSPLCLLLDTALGASLTSCVLRMSGVQLNIHNPWVRTLTLRMHLNHLC